MARSYWATPAPRRPVQSRCPGLSSRAHMCFIPWPRPWRTLPPHPPVFHLPSTPTLLSLVRGRRGHRRDSTCFSPLPLQTSPPLPSPALLSSRTSVFYLRPAATPPRPAQSEGKLGPRSPPHLSRMLWFCSRLVLRLTASASEPHPGPPESESASLEPLHMNA